MLSRRLREIVRIARGEFVSEEEQAYRRLRARGFQPAGIIDVGAYEGNWTRMARRVFADVPVLMVEAQGGKRAVLEATARELGVEYVQAVLADQAGAMVTFYEMGTGSSLLPERSDVARAAATYLTSTLDDAAAKMHGPLFLKIDVQGAELMVLAGAGQTLAQCELVQLEVAMLSYNEGAPSFLEVISYMNERDFVPFDFSGFTRPNGRDLVQVDMLFARRNSSLRPNFFEF